MRIEDGTSSDATGQEITEPALATSSSRPRTYSRFLRTTGSVAQVLVFYGSIVVISGTSSILSDVAFNSFGLSRAIENALDNMRYPRPTEPQLPVSEDGERTVLTDATISELIRGTISAYDSWANAGHDLQSLLTSRQPEALVKLVNQIGTNFLIEGVGTLQTAQIAGLSSDKLNFDAAQNALWINGEGYNLNRGQEKHLAGVWIQTRAIQLESQIKLRNLKEGEDVNEIPLFIQDLSSDLETLQWLKKQNFPIDIEQDSFGFFPRLEMVRVGRILKAVNELMPDLANQIRWCDSICIKDDPKQTGRIIGTATYQEQRIVLNNSAGAYALAHELGHLLQFRKLLFQSFEQIRGEDGQAVEEHKLRYLSKHAMENGDEDFATTFADYLARGEDFRLKLRALHVYSPEDWQFLQAKYNFMQDVVFGGLEFTNEATAKDEKYQKDQAFAGITWDPENGNTIAVQPNPVAWPEKKFVYREFPVFNQDGLAAAVVVGYSYDSKTGVYNVNISDPKLVDKIVFRPILGKERVLVTPQQQELSNRIDPGVLPTQVINLGTNLGAASFKVESLDGIRPGFWEIVDNDVEYQGVPIREKAGSETNNPVVTILNSGNPVQATGLWEEKFYRYTGKVERFWQVKVGDKKGWVSERWLGKEVPVQGVTAQ
ncbi:hypothetical protein HYW43_01435 [Candidatus Daviesbacteria bacterium]|nr:hypothetical protein [Candidatus Daviesbacteria bacterium]